jgi:hypothetical protein
MKNAHASGESDAQIMVRAYAVFSNENSDKQFLLEYWWREVKGQPKWERMYPSILNKRTKLNASTSLLQIKIQTKLVLKYIIALLARRQQKHKKGKEKVSSHCSEGYLSNDIVNSFNDF